MISKSRIKLITSLQQKKYRREEKLFIAEGEKVVRDLLRSDWDVIALYGTDSFFRDLPNDVRIAKTTEVVLVNDEDLKKISALTTPQHVLAMVRMKEVEDRTERNGIMLLLDNLGDPGNLGTIIRIADWFGIRDIFCSKETVDCYNPKVVQGSMGSLFKVNIMYVDLKDLLAENAANQKLPVYATVLGGDDLYKVGAVEDAYILMGSESSGIDRSVLDFATHRVTIPASGSAPDSLNVAIATGIICYEFRRLKKS